MPTIEERITAVDKTKAAFKSAENNAKKMGKGVQKASKNFDAMQKNVVKGTLILGAFALGAKALWATLKGGAEAKQTAASFEFLRAKVGGATDVLQQMRKAVRGTVDDSTLMASTLTLTAGAGDELAKKLFDAAPRLAEIAKASNKLNPALGDTAFLMESLGTGVKRASPLILDNLGLTIKVGDANEKMAQQLGKTVAQLSAEEKQMAILNATLEAGSTLIEQVGGSTEAAGDSLARFETRAENLISDLQVLAVDGVLPTLDALNAIETAFDSTSTRTEKYEATLAALTSRYGENNQKTILVRQSLEKWEFELQRARDETIGYRSDIEAMTAALEKTESIDANAEAQRQLAEGIATAEANARTYAEFNRSEFAQSFAQPTEAADALAAGMQNYTTQLLFNKASADLDASAALQLGLAMGVVDSKTIIATEALAGLKVKYDTNKDGAIDAAEAAAGFTRDVLALGNAIESMPDRKDITIGLTIEGALPDFGERKAGEPVAFAQHGGPLSSRGLTVVGEGGPELIAGNRVFSNPDSRRIVSVLEAILAVSSTGGNQFNFNVSGQQDFGNLLSQAQALAGSQ